MYDALTIAKYIINKCFNDGKPVTNLRLQKLLYFIQGMSYVFTGNALIRENFHAWQYGPVIPEIYFKYCGYIGDPLRLRYEVDCIADSDERIINAVIQRLEGYSDGELVELSHRNNGPWYRHRKDKSVIGKREIKEYFQGLKK